MKTVYETINLPSYEEIPESERDDMLKLSLECCKSLGQQVAELYEQLALNVEQILGLKDQIAILKGEKARPDVKASTVNKERNDVGRGSDKKKRRRGKPLRKKTRELEIHEEIIIEPDNIPEGAIFNGYEDYVVQEIDIKPKNTKYRRARYYTATGEHLVGALPESVQGSHFGVVLRSYILSQHYEQHVTQPLLLQQLWSFGINISAGQLGRILIEKHEELHQEKLAVLQAGLEVSSYVNVDDTGARHKGKNGFSTHIGNEFFAWFCSTESKSRINFLELLRAGEKDYIVDDVAREYMRQQRLPNAQLGLLCDNKRCLDKISWEHYLKSLGIESSRHIRIATEGALVGSIVEHGLNPELVIVSDDAGQFDVAGFLNALCWVHAERTINKIIGYSDKNRDILKRIQEQIWEFYQQLKDFKLAPSLEKSTVLDRAFDNIFTQKTSFQTLNLALGRIYNNKEKLLLVLRRPEIPLHNNLSESHIRDYVKKRKISASTRSDEGRRSRDTFLSLKKTCRKLGVSFWEFLKDRLSRQYKIPQLPVLIRAAADTT